MPAPKKLPNPQEAREQCAEYLGFVASMLIQAGDKVFEIPNPSMLDDDQQTRLDALELEAESWDRDDDVLNEDGTVRVRGALKVPHRKNGEPVENYNIQLAKGILGEDFAAFRAAGGRSSDVNLIWTKMQRELADRMSSDSKSATGDSEVAAVSGEAES